MIYTKAKFKKLWESDNQGGGITFEDIADCAKDWGLYSKPKIHAMSDVLEAVVKAAGCILEPSHDEES